MGALACCGMDDQEKLPRQEQGPAKALLEEVACSVQLDGLPELTDTIAHAPMLRH